MFKMTMAAAAAIALAVSASPVAAQSSCSVGVYANADATSSVVTPNLNETFEVYVVLFAESLADGLSYSLIADGLGTDYLRVGAEYGPDGGGLNIESFGENVALGQCVPGFNSFPIVVAKYTFLQVNPSPPTTSIAVGGGRENPDFPVFSNCAGQLITCVSGATLSVDNAVSSDSDSFGAVKSLFRN